MIKGRFSNKFAGGSERLLIELEKSLEDFKSFIVHKNRIPGIIIHTENIKKDLNYL